MENGRYEKYEKLSSQRRKSTLNTGAVGEKALTWR
jgi:hypothetical protein